MTLWAVVSVVTAAEGDARTHEPSFKRLHLDDSQLTPWMDLADPLAIDLFGTRDVQRLPADDQVLKISKECKRFEHSAPEDPLVLRVAALL
eukprot:CAMPEP_0174707858 /NCGR_PEP_ID=MMETSP1094-20130205/10262_1 /TAXON_ID=156173 /ORGANISM="Chrysochromulina brevifilum, Strain UTEX LB 985" /LENGTH=90 /DNA_ID=CAMNT_0015906311 /DNA_START=63 /DNA_END=333 /DNA_ORIENTATION=+